jgi:glycosyltransferase involved in cell wall biosynthesis
MKVLHLTAHLGGGVGKALSRLVAQSRTAGSGVEHTIVCLEEPEKSEFANMVTDSGGIVYVRPDSGKLDELIAQTDIVQLEWWNHPATLKCLHDLGSPSVRLLVWSHISGLFNPVIPEGLVRAAHRFLFTSPCSFEAKNIAPLVPEFGERLQVVSSSGGFNRLPLPRNNASEPLSALYVGSLNFAKLHPDYVDFLAALRKPGFNVRMIGDLTNREQLTQACIRQGKPGLLEFRGYSTDIAAELASGNILVYLLNPTHYGTTENALLEAMAIGIVPVVLGNPAERRIIEHRKTGLIINSPAEFADAIDWLDAHPEERQRLGVEAARSVRERFSVEKTDDSLTRHYGDLLHAGKRKIHFGEIFAGGPSDWFRACQGDPAIFRDDGSIAFDRIDRMSAYALLERTKGTVFHFREYFPDDMRLVQWAKNLESLQ